MSTQVQCIAQCWAVWSTENSQTLGIGQIGQACHLLTFLVIPYGGSCEQVIEHEHPRGPSRGSSSLRGARQGTPIRVAWEGGNLPARHIWHRTCRQLVQSVVDCRNSTTHQYGPSQLYISFVYILSNTTLAIRGLARILSRTLELIMWSVDML